MAMEVPLGYFSLAQAFTPAETKPKYQFLFISAPFRGREGLILIQFSSTNQSTPPEGGLKKNETVLEKRDSSGKPHAAFPPATCV